MSFQLCQNCKVIFMIGHQVLCIKNLEFGLKSLFEFSYFFLKNFFGICCSIDTPCFDGKQEISVFFQKAGSVPCSYFCLVGLCNVLENKIHRLNQMRITVRFSRISQNRVDIFRLDASPIRSLMLRGANSTA